MSLTLFRRTATVVISSVVFSLFAGNVVLSKTSINCDGVEPAIVNGCGIRWVAANLRVHAAANKLGSSSKACVEKTAVFLEDLAADWISTGSYTEPTKFPCGQIPEVGNATDGLLLIACPGAIWSYGNRGMPKCDLTTKRLISIFNAPNRTEAGSSNFTYMANAPPEIDALQKQLNAIPNDPATIRELASRYLAIGEPQRALAMSQKLVQLDTDNAQAYILDGVANQALGHTKEAEADFEHAAHLEPTNSQILLTLTNLYLQTQRSADAERIAVEAVNANPNDKRALENLGLVLGQEGKYDEARTQFENAAKLDPQDATPIVLEARAYVSQKLYPAAVEQFDRALTVDPNNLDALLGKALLEATNHQVSDSISTFEHALNLEPSDDGRAAVLVQEYEVYRDEKMNDEALATLKRAEAAYPSAAAIHIAYGDFDMAVGNDSAAGVAEWKRALGPGNDNPDALGRLAQYSLSNHSPDDALPFLKRLTEVSPKDPQVWLTYGQAQAQQKQFSEAQQSFKTSFNLSHTPQALAGLGSVDFELHKFTECEQIFEAIDRGAPDVMNNTQPQLLYVFGKCAQGNKDNAKALKAYTRFKPFVKPGSELDVELSKAMNAIATRQK